MSKAVYALAGVLAALIFAVLLLPARAVTLATDRIDELALHGIRGTLRQGEADVVYRGIGAGRLTWNVDWLALFDAQLAMRWRLEGAGHGFTGRLSRGFDSSALTAAGSVDAAKANPLLGNYDIHIGGILAVDALSVRSSGGAPTLTGRMRWSGGGTTYRLAGRTYNTDLPPMTANLSTDAGKPRMEVRLEQDGTPLIAARLRDGGVEVGITKRFTVLAGKPWPGNAPPHAIVLTVERELPHTWRGSRP